MTYRSCATLGGMSRRIVLTSAGLAGALLAAPAIAATSSPATPSERPSASSTPAPSATSQSSPTSTAATSAPAPGVKSVKVDKALPLKTAADGKVNATGFTDPTALFSQQELKQVLPNLTDMSTSNGTYTLTATGEDASNRSTLVVVVKQTGKTSDVRKAWDERKKDHQARSARNPGLYTFTSGQYGVADSFSDGTTAHVLLTNGDAAAEVWFSGIGFTSLASTHAAARSNYRNHVIPALTQLLGDKVRAGGASEKPAATKTPSSNAATPRS